MGAAIPCAIVLPRICQRTATIFVRCRNSWDTKTSAPPWSIHMCCNAAGEGCGVRSIHHEYQPHTPHARFSTGWRILPCPLFQEERGQETRSVSGWANPQSKLKRGWSSSKDTQAHQAARENQRLPQQVADLCQHRPLVVKRRLSPASSHTVKRGHRRQHKRQKSVYGSHRKNRLIMPIALDMIREASAKGDNKHHSPCMMLARRHMTQNPCYSLRSLQVLPTGAPARASALLD